MTSCTYIRSLFTLISTMLLVACGGGGSSSQESPTPPPQPANQTHQVTVIDGYLQDATVWLDINSNYKKDNNEPSAETNENGVAELSVLSSTNIEDHSLLAQATAGKTYDKSLASTVAEDFILAAPAGKNVITPLTTLVYIKEKESNELNIATTLVSAIINVVSEDLFEDFIATQNTHLENVAADLVRLSLMPESSTHLEALSNDSTTLFDSLSKYMDIRRRGENGTYVMLDSKGELSGDTDLDGIADNDDIDIDSDGIANENDAFPYDIDEWEDLDSDGVGNNSDNDIDGDGVANEEDIFPYNSSEWADLDSDGVGDNSDNDIDGDGIINDEDSNPYIIDYYTKQNPGVLSLTDGISSSINDQQWHYFKVDVAAGEMLNIKLSNLSEDVDLYVSLDDFPDKFKYLCRSNVSNQLEENCRLRSDTVSTYYIGIFARGDANYTLSAFTESIVHKQAILLLHGLASSPDTWSAMVNDDSFFDGKCTILAKNESASGFEGENQNGPTCFNLKFGSLDRNVQHSAKGLDNLRCNSALGCNGDFTSFDGLGLEVEFAIGQIIEHLGNDVDIFLFGHSRGGLAARAYLQNQTLSYKPYVKGFATTGSPHQGSPLGRFYKYMEDNCTPKSIYRQDGDHCEDNWEVIEMLNGTRTYFGFDIGLEYQMELQAPSVDFLSPESEAITKLNNNISQLSTLVIGQLTYSGTTFGILSKDAGLAKYYDLYKYGTLFAGDHPHPDTLRYIENGETRESFIGDGIVPVKSQRLSYLLENEGINITVAGNQDAPNILHTEETKRVSDINWLFERLYQSLDWK